MEEHGTRDLPTGTVTFVFTDIEGSTQRAEQLGDEAWAELLETHYDLLRDAFEAHGGVEVKTDGDAFFVAFERATDAVAAVVDGQRALEGHPWPNDQSVRVRMGLHTGEAIIRNDDYIGHDVHRASRICDAAHGGQVLVSEATAALVQDALPEDAALTDLGLHRLKDLGSPQHLFTVEALDLQRDFPPLRTLEGFPNNLPVQRSAFVGRGKEIARTRKLLETHPLVTLTGMGGCGKTRLALQVAAEELDRHPDGVFLVDLAPVSDPDLVPNVTADVVDLQLGGGPTSGAGSVVDLLVDALTRRHCLLVLDNCEHLLDASADLADRILVACPRVRVLATSREPLDVEGEQVYRVPSLSLPEDGNRSEAVDLFAERATTADPDFELTPDNAETVAQICRRVDGIPLAVEFAAARVDHLSPTQIAERLDDRFRLLTGGRRRIRRQQTLEAALDWSHDLLDPDEQVLLRRLAVFAGTFPLAMVEETCTDDCLSRSSILDVLGSLVAKSLVATETDPDEIRYRLLETVRNYAEGKLRDAGEADTFRTRHRDAYLAWLESVPLGRLFDDPATLRLVRLGHDNIRAALDWSLVESRRDLVGRIAGRLTGLWWWRGHHDEGHAWLTEALEDPGRLSTDEEVMCRAAEAFCSMQRADGQTEEHARRAIELDRSGSTGPLVQAFALRAHMTGIQASRTGEPELERTARSLTVQSVEAAEDLPGVWEAFAFGFRGLTELILGDVDAGTTSSRTALELIGDPASMWGCLIAAQLSFSHHLAENLEAALEAAQQGLEAQHRTDGQLMYPHVSLANALAHASLGHRGAVSAHLADAIHQTDTHGVPLMVTDCLIVAAAVAFRRGNPAATSRLLAASQAVGGARGFAFAFRTPMSYLLYVHYRGLVREALDPQDARRYRDEGRAMTREGALADALDLAQKLPEAHVQAEA